MSSFDPAFDFLLDMRFDNLFEQRSAVPGSEYFQRCKGCGAELTLPEREKHHRKHKHDRDAAKRRAIDRARARGLAAARRARRATVSG